MTISEPRAAAPDSAPADIAADSTRAPTAWHSLLVVAERNAQLLLFVAFVALLFFLAIAPSLLVADTWLTLVAGREIAEHGLPSVDHLTVVAAGAEWTDQQWLAQIAFYAVERVGSLPTLVVVGISLALLAFAGAMGAARARGAGVRATVLVSFLVLFAAPWSWQVRAQTLALPLFVAVLWLLVEGSRSPSRRTLLVLPLLVLWANVHGSVVLGALLAMLYGAIELARRTHAPRALAFLVLPPLCVLASPYALDLPAYYRLMLVDAPFADVIREWQPSRPAGNTVAFYALAALALALVARHPRRLTPFETATLVVTFAGAVTAIRGIAWFALSALVVLPYALEGVLPGRRGQRGSARVHRFVAVTSLVAVAAAAVATLVRPAEWLEREWPAAMRQAVAAAAEDPGVRVYPSDRHADWLLWEVPSLRGRVAYDVRFELYTDEQLDRIVAYDSESGSDWQRIADGYRLIVVDERSYPSHTADFASEPGSRVLYRDGERTVILRAAR